MTTCVETVVIQPDTTSITVQSTEYGVVVRPDVWSVDVESPTPHEVSVEEPPSRSIVLDTIPSTTAPLPRKGIDLSGAMDDVNLTFTAPETFVAAGGYQPEIYYNGMRLHRDDYILSEAAPGAGYDTVTLACAPSSGDSVTADYYLA